MICNVIFLILKIVNCSCWFCCLLLVYYCALSIVCPSFTCISEFYRQGYLEKLSVFLAMTQKCQYFLKMRHSAVSSSRPHFLHSCCPSCVSSGGCALWLVVPSSLYYNEKRADATFLERMRSENLFLRYSFTFSSPLPDPAEEWLNAYAFYQGTSRLIHINPSMSDVVLKQSKTN